MQFYRVRTGFFSRFDLFYVRVEKNADENAFFFEFCDSVFDFRKISDNI